MTERELTIGLRLTAAFSAAAMGALVAGGAEGPVRSVVALVFLLLAPGLVVVDIARPRSALEHVVLAVGMSFAIEVAVALGMLYAGVWRPETAVLCLAAFVLAGSAATAIPANARTGAAPVRRRWLIVLAAAGIGVLAGIVLTDGD
jgi:uncharacterized membrane protein